jgi:hypothetical protein
MIALSNQIKRRPEATTMKNNLKIVIAIVVAVILAAAIPVLIWKFTSHPGAVHPAGNGDGQYLDRKQLAFAGYATPEATLQSMFWAANSGDGDQLFACFSPEGQVAIGKEPNGRKNFDAGVKKAAQAQSIKGLQVVARKVLADDQVELKFKLDFASPPKNGERDKGFAICPLVKIGGEWKLSGKKTKDYTPDWDNGSQPEPAAP